jgi:hypothetical protein
VATTLERRLAALERSSGGGLRIIWFRWLSRDGEVIGSATIGDETVYRRSDESEDAFRQRPTRNLCLLLPPSLLVGLRIRLWAGGFFLRPIGAVRPPRCPST